MSCTLSLFRNCTCHSNLTRAKVAFSSGKMCEMEVHKVGDVLLLPRIKVERKEMDKSLF